MDWLGDRDVVGIVTTLAYLAAFVACFVVMRQAAPRTVNATMHRWFWFVVGGVELLLGLNKQADLQIALTRSLRAWARSGGWYHNRRQLQFAFCVVVTIAVVIALIVAWRKVRTWPAPYWVALLAIALQMLYVLIRIASFHHLDALLSMDWSHLKLSWMIELFGVVLCLLAAMAVIWRRDVPLG